MVRGLSDGGCPQFPSTSAVAHNFPLSPPRHEEQFTCLGVQEGFELCWPGLLSVSVKKNPFFAFL